MIAVIDYGVCNVGSIQNILRKLDIRDIRIVTDPEQMKTADHLILPGIGSFDHGVSSLMRKGFFDAIDMFARSGKPVLGICLGMQMLGRRSEEGELEGLNLVPMECKHFESDGVKIPHMGWDRVVFLRESSLLKGIEEPQRYYFVHSYYAVCDHRRYELMSCDYGHQFSAAVQCENIYGVQFHPEKSHLFGMKLLKNFVENC